jgi:serine/threonine-protein kinase
MALAAGATFAGYRVIEQLGAGGMGEVYLVEHPHLGRREALKVISVRSDDPSFSERFTSEARTAASLDHPDIVTVYHYGIEDGQPWYTMAYIAGTDLSGAGPLPPHEVVAILTRVADALDDAHAHRIIHRDIKPANILVTRGADGSLNRVTVLDFGIARLLDSTRMTTSNAFIGTVAYAAPEVLTGSAASPASDQYALACTTFELLTGRAPYVADNPGALMMGHINSPIPRVSAADPTLAPFDDVFRRALAKTPEQRFPNCAAFASAFANAAAHMGPSAPAPAAHFSPVPGVARPPVHPHVAAPAWNPQPPRGRPRRGLAIGVGVAALVLVMALVAVVVAVVADVGDADSTSALPRSEFLVQNPAEIPVGGWVSTSVGAGHACAIATAGSAYCWGNNDAGQLGNGISTGAPVVPVKVVGLAHVTAISAGSGHTCAIDSGRAWCWGENDKGQLGNRSTTDSATPVEVVGLTDVTAISASINVTCAVAQDVPYCWGKSTFALGDGSSTASTTPVRVLGLTDSTSVSTVANTSCATATGGTVFCWGGGSRGTLGDGRSLASDETDSTVPVRSGTLTGVSQVSVGSLFGTACALSKADVYCWGDNHSGQAGVNESGERGAPNLLVPRQVHGVDDVTSISVGDAHTCAISNARAVCWGDNADGQVTGTAVPRAFTPNVFDALTHVTSVAAGSEATCAVDAGNLYCWGNGLAR